MVLSLTLMPVLASFGLPRRMADKETLIDRAAHRFFQPLLHLGLRFPWTTLGLVALLTIATTILGFNLGSEFVPKLGEGTIVINTVRLAGVSLGESLDYGTHIERILKEEFPDEVGAIWSRTGTAEVATDPMGLELSDIFIALTPRDRWKKAATQEALVEAMSEITEQLPGMRAVYGQPIEERINEMVAGIKADLGIKLFGDDLEVLKERAAEIVAVVQAIPGAADVGAEQVTGQPMLRVEVDRNALARHGISSRQVLEAVEAAGGIVVGEVLEPGRRFPLAVRLPWSYRDDPRALERIMIPTAAGGRLSLLQLARLERTSGPSTIQREWGQRRIVVQANVRGRDLGTFVQEAQRRITREVKLPEGYSVEWGGQFENMLRAERRLTLVVPLALALILSLLYLTFHSLRDAVMIFSGVLFARVGGVLGLWIMGLPFTISAGVGFVALAGASMLEGLILVSAIRDRMAHGVPKREAIEQARLARLRPVLMTGTVAALGFLPMMPSTGIGAEVQRPLATVVIGGLLTSMLLKLVVLPAIYPWFDPGPLHGDHDEEEPPAPLGDIAAE
jgi:cobalt-zinc-cadmium resistance protein CzcA